MDEPHLIDTDLATRWRASGLKPLHLAGRTLLPLVQGGMGVGVSAHRLAGSLSGLVQLALESQATRQRQPEKLVRDTRRHRPLDADLRIVPTHRALMCRRVVVGALVKEVGALA